MARAKQKDVLKGYRDRIDASKKWRKDEGYDELWQMLVDLYRGKQYSDLSEEDRLVINVAFATVNVIGPSVSVNHPKIAVNARKPEDGDRAVITEEVINYWWKHYGVQSSFKRAVKDFLIVGHGWIKAGYRFVEEQQAAAESYGTDDNGEAYDIDDYADPTVDNPVETTTVITEDRPFAERVSFHDVYVDPCGTCMEDIGWIAQRIRRAVKAVKNDKRYKKSARDRVSASSYARFEAERPKHGNYEKNDAGKDGGYVDVWEFYDLRKKTIATFADCADGEDEEFLIAPRPAPYAFGHPFVMIRNYDVPEFFYPLGDLECLEPLQRELNATRTQMLNHRKRYQRKWLYDADRFDPDGRSGLESDEDNIMVKVKGGGPLSDAVAPMPAIPVPPDFYSQSELIEQDIDRTTGVSEYQRGGMPEVRRTATEAAMLQDAANARSADKLAIVENAIGIIASRLVALAQQYMTSDQVVRVTGAEGGPHWLKFDREWIQGEFDFDVEGGSTQPNNESFRRQSALQLVDAMAPFVGAGVVNMPMLAQHVMRAFGISNPEAFIDATGMAGMPPPFGMPGAEGGAPPGGPMPPGGPPMPPEGGAPPMGEPPVAGQGGQSIPPEVLRMLETSKGLTTPNIPVG